MGSAITLKEEREMVVLIFATMVLVAVLIGVPYFTSSSYDRVPNMFMTFFAGMVFLGWIPMFTVACTSGLLPDYSDGYRDGVIIKASQKGVIWKTNEILLALGSKDSVAFQEPVSFSVPDEKIWSNIDSYVGKNIRIRYKQWLIMPYSMGSSNKEVVLIEERSH